MEALAATEHKHKTSGPSKVEGSMGRGRSPLGKTVAAVRLVVGQGSSSRTSGADCLQCPLAGAPSFFFPSTPVLRVPMYSVPDFIATPHDVPPVTFSCEREAACKKLSGRPWIVAVALRFMKARESRMVVLTQLE